MASPEDEISARIIMTPAEGALLMEQAETLKVSVNDMQQALDIKDYKAMGKAWESMGESMSYIGTILNIKASVATRQFIHEQMGE